jgi:hypothetical protein
MTRLFLQPLFLGRSIETKLSLVARIFNEELGLPFLRFEEGARATLAHVFGWYTVSGW